jgi:hypothetical protein
MRYMPVRRPRRTSVLVPEQRAFGFPGVDRNLADYPFHLLARC